MKLREEEIIGIIKCLPSKKAPGLDGLGSEFFKHIAFIIVPNLKILLLNKIIILDQIIPLPNGVMQYACTYV